MKFKNYLFNFILLGFILILTGCFNKSSDSKLKNKVGVLDKEEIVQGPIGNSALSFTPDTWAFGALLTNSEIGTKTFTVKNISEKPLTLKQTEVTNAEFEVLASTCSENKILIPNATCEITMEFAPTVGGIFSSIATVHYEAENGVEIFYSALNLTGSGSTLLNFDGLESIDNITGTKMTLNWTGVDEVDSYQIYRINGTNVTLISSQSEDNFCTGFDCEYEVTGLSPGTAYTFRVRATDTGGVQESNLVNVTESTWGAATFASISNITVAEGATTQTANLSCANGNGSVNAFSFISQSDAVTDCSITGATGATVKVECSPGYKTGHSNWSGTVTVACTIDDQTFQRTFTVNVSDSNRAPEIELHPSSNQSIAAGSAMTSVNSRDSNSSNDTDRDGDTITYSCTFEGGGNAAGTACSSLPQISYSFNTSTGVLNWTPSIAAAVGAVPTDYTITISGTDGSLADTTSIEITVNPAVIITDLDDYLFPSDYIDIGETLSVNANNIAGGSPGADTNMTYTCTFDKVIDSAVAAGTNCTSLPGTTASFNTTSGTLTWVPNSIAYGAYEIKIAGTNTDTVTDDEIFLVDVRAPYILTDLIGSFEAQFAKDGASSGINSAFTSVLKDLTSALTTNDGELNNFAETTASGWTGDGSRTISSASDGPYRLVFDGTDDYVDLGTSMNNQNDLRLSTWIRPNNITERGKIIFSNSDATNSRGVKVKQSYDGTGRIQVQMGKSIDDEYMEDSPTLYWQMNENSTYTTGAGAIKDSSGNGYHGTPNVWSLGGSGSLAATNHTPIKVAGTNGSGGSWSKWTRSIDRSNFSFFDGSTSFSVEMFYYISSADNSNYGMYYWGDGVASSTNMIAMSLTNGSSGARLAVYVGGLSNYVSTPISSLAATSWHHIVVRYDGSQATNTTKVTVYINGVNQTLTSAGTIPSSIPDLSGTGILKVGSAVDSGGGAYYDNPQQFAHFAIYPTLLSPARISTHYASRQKSACASQYPLTNDAWTHLDISYNSGTTIFSSHLNGRKMCSKTATFTYANSTEPLIFGADENQANHWEGEMAELKIYSSFANWDVFDHLFSTQYRFGRTKEKPVTDRLIAFFDAANAQREGGNYTAGACTNTSHKWYGTSSYYENFSASFVNFNTTDCSNGTDGWAGDGTTANPYHVKFDGTNDYMTLSNDIDVTGDFTLVAWIKRNGTNWSHIFSVSSAATYPFF